MDGDEEEGAEMDDFEDEFPVVKSPKKPPHEPVAFDVYSENGEPPAQKWRTGGHTLSSFTGSGELHCIDDMVSACCCKIDLLNEYVCVCAHCAVAGKDLEAEREMEGSMEWKDRIDKWKTKQEKRGRLNHDDSDDDDDKNDDEYML